MDGALVRGVAWTGATRWATQGLSWVATIVIANLLTKADYGLVGMAMLFTGYVNLLNELGLGVAIIRRRDLDRDTLASLGGIAVALGCTLWAVSALLAIPLARFFGEPAVRGIVAALGFGFVLSALRVVPRSLLSRELRFRRVAVIDSADALTNTIVTLVMAWSGWGYWALVGGNLVGGVASTLLAILARPHPLRVPGSLAPLRDHLSLGGSVVATRTAWYLYSNADFAVVGRLLGKEALGAYTFGWNLATIPINRFASLLQQVMPAIFSAVQHDRAAIRRYFLLVSEGLALLSFPFAAGLVLVAPDLITVALNPEWHAAVLPLQFLAAYAGLRTLTTVFPQLLQTLGRHHDALKYNLIALVVLPPLFVLGAHFGPSGVAAAWIVGYPLVMTYAFRNVFEVTGASFADYLRALLPATLATSGMVGAVLALRYGLASTWSPGGRLAAESLLGTGVYAGLLWKVSGPRLLTIRKVLLQVHSPASAS